MTNRSEWLSRNFSRERKKRFYNFIASWKTLFCIVEHRRTSLRWEPFNLLIARRRMMEWMEVTMLNASMETRFKFVIGSCLRAENMRRAPFSSLPLLTTPASSIFPPLQRSMRRTCAERDASREQKIATPTFRFDGSENAIHVSYLWLGNSVKMRALAPL